MMNILYLLPKNLLSHLVGKWVHIRWPGPLRVWLIQSFGKFYKIRFDEAEAPPEAYASIGDFFTRKLKPGVRPLAKALVVHPADAKISQTGKIEQGKLIQAKGRSYSAGQFLQDEKAEEIFSGGLFATYYLCPTDYHRVHAPVTAGVESLTVVPGALWPVNNWSVDRIENLFCVNERVVVRLQAEFGPIALVMVGATNVGQMTIQFEPRVRSNSLVQRTPLVILYGASDDKTARVQLTQGEELGTFHMGSTVVMLYSREFLERSGRTLPGVERFLNQSVLMGGEFLL